MMSLLVVERELSLSSELRTRTAELGWPAEVVLVGDPQAAGLALRERPFDLVVAPCRDAGADAVELALAAAAPGSRIARLALIGGGGPGSDGEIMAGGRILLAESLDEALSLTEQAIGEASGDGIDVMGLVRIAAASAASLAARLHCDRGEGTLRFRYGVPVHASTGALAGDDAFFEMVLWGSGLVEGLPEDEGSQLVENLSRPVLELLDEAARFQALLTSDEEPPAQQAAAHAEPGKQGFATLWARVVARDGGARLVIACPATCAGGCCRRLAEHLADVLDAPLPGGLERAAGPSFLRLYPAAGGTLSLTLVPATPRNRFLFESLVRSAQGVVLCSACARDEGWRSLLPAALPCAVATTDDPRTWPVTDVLERLVGEEP